MKLRVFALFITGMFLVGCGSARKKVESKPKRVVLEPIKTKEVKTPKVEVIKRERFTVTTKDTENYIKNFASIAIEEMKMYKIPASITLAQGILESGSGRSPLAIRSNNHFGIKCHKEWEGKRVTYDDDDIGECFRKYKHPKMSYEDHSKFLRTRSRYANLFKLKITDYKGWAYGLKRAGYATDPRYPQKLISLIERYNLNKYDKYYKGKEYKHQQNIHHKVQKGDTLYSIAVRYNTTVDKLKKDNNLKDNTISIGQYLIIK